MLSSITNGGTQNFVLGYDYINDLLVNNTTIGADTLYWYQQAPLINGNDTSKSVDVFIRSATAIGLQWDGNSTSGIQATSDAIASSVIKDIISNSRIPTVDTLITDDITAALGIGQQTIGGWGGAFYYWNAVLNPATGQTVGQAITSNPTELEKFIDVNAAAAATAFATDPFDTLKNLQSAFFGAQVPTSIALQIADRAISLAIEGGSVAGNPDIIDGWYYLGTNSNGSSIWVTSVSTFDADVPPVYADSNTAATLDSTRQIRINEQNLNYSSATGVTVNIDPDSQIAVMQFGSIGPTIEFPIQDIDKLVVIDPSNFQFDVTGAPQIKTSQGEIFSLAGSDHVTDNGGVLEASYNSGSISANSGSISAIATIDPDGLGNLSIVIDHQTIDAKFTSSVVELSEVGQVFGSVLGNYIAGTNPFAQIAVSSVLGSVGQSFGAAIQSFADSTTGLSLTQALSDSFANLPTEVGSAGLGAIGSYLSAQLVNAIGINGTAGQLLNTVDGAVIGKIASNIVSGASDAFSGAFDTVNLEGAVGSFVGAQLGALIYSPQTVDGQLGSSIGSAIGGAAGIALAAGAAAAATAATTGVAVTALGTAGAAVSDALGVSAIAAELGVDAGEVGAFLLPGVGALVGFLLGAVIGDLIGGAKQIPEAMAQVDWSDSANGFVVGATTARRGATTSEAVAIAQSAATTLNELVSSIGGMVINGDSSNPGVVGFVGSNYIYRPSFSYNAPTTDFTDVNQLITLTVFNGLQGLDIAGGDVYQERALQATVANAYDANGNLTADLNTLSGNLQIAKDYESYLQNETVINSLIAAEPNTAFSDGWIVELTEAIALGLNKRGVDDWSAGWDGFLQSQADADPTDVSFGYDGNERIITVNGTEVGDTIDSSAKDTIVGNANTANFIDVLNDTVQMPTTGGFTIDGNAPTAPYQIQVAAMIYAGNMGDTIIGGNLGNDIFGGSGNDSLVGGANADWIFGGAGNDTIDGGGGTGDYLSGGDGNDSITAADGGSAWLDGGAGNNTLIGSPGDDILSVGVGTYEYLAGGGGHDTYIVADGSQGAPENIVIVDNGNAAALTGSDSLAYNPATDTGGWAGTGASVANDDTLTLGPGIGLGNLIFSWQADSGGDGSDDLVIKVFHGYDANNNPIVTSTITLVNWANPLKRIEWLELSNGQKIQLGDFQSFIAGGSGNEHIVGTNGDDFIYTGGGNDTVNSLLGNDVDVGGTGNNFIDGGGGNDLVLGGTGNDTLFGGPGSDLVSGGLGNDLLIGGATDISGNDTLVGGPGNDTVIGSPGQDDFRYGVGDGSDLLIPSLDPTKWQVVWISSAMDGMAAGFQPGFANNGSFITADNGALNIFNQSTYAMPNGVLEQEPVMTNGAYTGDYEVLWQPDLTHTTTTGSDTLDFGAGIDINMLQFERSGSDLIIGIDDGNYDPTQTAGSFASLEDKIDIRNFYTSSTATNANPVITQFNFLSTGAFDTTAVTNWIGGTDGNDLLTAPAGGTAWITGGAGDDTLIGGDGADTLNGGDGNDSLAGGAGDDVLLSGTGNSTLDGGPGADTLVGGGEDFASYADATAGVTVYLAGNGTNTGDAAGDQLIDISGIIGSAYADTIYGSPTNGSTLEGGGGNDSLIGGPGGDEYDFSRGDGNDTISDAGGNDRIVMGPGIGLDNLTFAWSGANLLITVDNNGGSILIDNANGAGAIETLAFDDGTSVGLSHVFIGTGATGDGGNDLFVASGAGGNTLIGGAGNDTVVGGAGNDSLSGGAGDDWFEGGPGADTIDGGTGNNTASYDSSSAAVHVDLSGATANTGGDAAGDVLYNIENVVGSAYNDTLIGDANANMLSGGAGQNSLFGGGGNDTLIAGDYGDVLVSGTGNSVLNGGAGNDSITAGPGDNELLGNAGNDTLVSSTGASDLYGGDGNDLLIGGGADTLYGGAGDDTLEAGSTGAFLSGDDGNDSVVGGIGNDTIYGGTGNNTLVSGGGDDIFYSQGNDSLVSGAGNDVFNFTSTSGSSTLSSTQGADDIVFDSTVAIDQLWFRRSGNDLLIDVIGGTAHIEVSGFFSTGNDGAAPFVRRIIADGETLELSQFSGTAAASNLLLEMASISGSATAVPTTMPAGVSSVLSNYWQTTGQSTDTISAGAGNDDIIGDDGNNLIYGNAGNDTITGGSGVNTIYGGDGNDSILGGPGSDSLSGDAGNDTIQGGAGGSTIMGGLGANLLTGGAGNDLIYGDGEQTGTAGDGPNTIIGGGGNDTLIGGGAGDSLSVGVGNSSVQGGVGNDTIYAAGGNNTLNGGLGNDLFVEGSGADSIIGGGGSDTVDYSNSPSAVTVDLGIGTGSGGYAQGDSYSGIENITGSSYNDTITGDANTNIINGGAGDDSIIGNGGNDTLYGGLGNDTLVAGSASSYLDGGDGNDSLVGGAGNDTLVGGPGNDTLVGGPGNDLYLLDGTSGNDLIDNYSNSPQDDAISYVWQDSSGVNHSVDYTDLWFQDVNNNLVISVIGTTATATVYNWFSTAGSNPFQVQYVFAADSGHTNNVFTVPINVADITSFEDGVAMPTTANLSTYLQQMSSDGVHTNQQRLDLDWTFNTPPTLAVPSAVGMNESITTPLNADTFAITTNDAETPAQLTITATSSNPALINSSEIQIGALQSDNHTRYVTFTPNEYQYGTAYVTFTVTDPGAASVSQTVALNVAHVDVPPAIQTGIYIPPFYENAQSTPISFGISDYDDGAYALSVTATSSNQSLIANSGISLTGSGASRTLTLTPVTDASGTDTINLTVTDPSGETATEQVPVTVYFVDQPPSISLSTTYTAFYEANWAAATSAPVAVYLSDPDNLSSVYLSATSNVPWLHPTLSGTQGTSLQYLTVTSDAFDYGVGYITLTASEGSNVVQQTLEVNVVPTAQDFEIGNASYTLSDTSAPYGFGGAPVTYNPSGTGLTWSIISGNSAGYFTIDPSTGVLSLAGADPSWPSSFNIGVEASDGAYAHTANVAVTMTDGHVPVFNNLNISNGIAYIQAVNYNFNVKATDADGSPITYSGYSITTGYNLAIYSLNASGADNNYGQPGIYGALANMGGAEPQYYILEATNSSGVTGEQEAYVIDLPYFPPVVLDLNNQGLSNDLENPGQANFTVAPNGSNSLEAQIGWVKPGAGILALDDNLDGTIDSSTEISFVQDVPGATTDLEGLAAFDTDHNGELDPGDAHWNDFRIWTDTNGDGISEPGELETLAQAGITSINLDETLTGNTPNGSGNVIEGTATFTRSNGTTGAVGDVDFGLVPVSSIVSNVSGPLSAAAISTNQTIYGTSGNDSLAGGVGNDTLIGGAGNDTLAGSSGQNQFSFTVGDGADLITDFKPGASEDSIFLNGVGNGVVSITNGSDGALINYGAASTIDMHDVDAATISLRANLSGATTVSYAGLNEAVSVDLSAVPTLPGAQVENVIGSNYASTLAGDSYANALTGGTGNDTINGGGGNDTIDGGGGHDLLTGGAGDDVFVLNGNDPAGAVSTITDFQAGSGGDVIEALNDATVNETIAFNTNTAGALAAVTPGNTALLQGISINNLSLESNFSGFWEFNFVALTSGVNLNLSQGEVGPSTTASPDGTAYEIIGTTSGDTVEGDDFGDYFDGNGGPDSFKGGFGNDFVVARGDSALDGGGGINTISYSYETSVTVNLATGTDSLGDHLANFQNVIGTSGNDAITGTSGNETIDGGAGNDTLVGGGGADTYKFDAGYGKDVIINGASANNSAAGQLQLGVGLTPGNLWFAQSGNDLVITALGTTTQVTVQGWFADNYAKLQDITLADGSQIGTAAINALASAMGVYQAAYSSFDPQTATEMPADTTLTTALNTNWSRVIDMTSSNQTLSAVYGNDTLIASGSNSTLIGDGLTTTLVGDGEGNTLIGTGGVNIAYYSTPSEIVNLATGTAQLSGSSVSDTLIGMTRAEVSGSSDTLISGTGIDTLIAFGTADTLIAEGGGDTININSGIADIIDAASSAITLASGTSATITGDSNTITATNATLTISGADGNTETIGGSGNTIYIDPDPDTINLSGSNQSITTYNGAIINVAADSSATIVGAGNVISLGTGAQATIAGNNDTITASSGDYVSVSGTGETLIGGSGASTFASMAGSATLFGNGGGSTLEALGGSVTADYAGIANLTVDLVHDTAHVIGSSTSDALVGITNVILAGAGDTLIGTDGKTTFVDSAGHTTLASSTTTIMGSNGYETLISVGSGNTLTAGTDPTVALYAAADVTVNLASGTATVNGSGANDTLIGITRVEVSGSNDTLIGANVMNTLVAGGVGDTLIGGAAGITTLQSNGGGNTLIAGAGIAVASYGSEINNIYYPINAVIDLASGGELVSGSSISDAFIGITVAEVYGYLDTLIGGAGIDTLISDIYSENNVLISGNGNNVLITSGEGDTLYGTSGQDTLISSNGASNILFAGTGANTLLSIGSVDGDTGVADTLIAGNGAVEVLISTGWISTLIGGSGTDTLSSTGGGSNTLIGGSGASIALYSNAYVTVNLSAGIAKANNSGANDTLIGITRAEASGLHDTLIGSATTDTLIALGADETLIGGSGTTTLLANVAGNTLVAGSGLTVAGYVANNEAVNLVTGTATVNGSSVSDTLVGIVDVSTWGNDETLTAANAGSILSVLSVVGSGSTLIGGTGDSELAELGNIGGNTLIAGSGPTTAYYGVYGETVSLATGTAKVNGSSVSDTLVGITIVQIGGTGNTLIGGSGTDTLVGSGVANTVIGGSGVNTLIAGGATTVGDTLIGGTGTTTFWAGTPGATFIAGTGLSVAAYTANNEAINLSAGVAKVNGSSVSDTLVGIAIAQVSGQSDTLIGGSGSDTLLGSNNYDTLIAGSGADTLLATGYFDTLVGSSGTDTLISDGQFGENTLIAGSGASVLVSYGGDELIAGSGADTLLTSGFYASRLIAGSGFDTLSSSGQNDTLIAGSGIDALLSTGIGDTLVGSANGSTLNGTGSTGDLAAYTLNNATINLAAGTAKINGSSVSDTLIGITGAQALGSGDTIIGGSGTETLKSNGNGNTLIAGTGITVADYGVNYATENLATSTAKVNGSSVSDTLVGITIAETSGYQDTLIGGAGSDTLFAVGSQDTLIGGDGAANVLLSNNNGYANYNTLIAGNGPDTLSTSDEFNMLIGGSGIDTLLSSGAANTLIGGSGLNTLIASGVSNTLIGGSGLNTLVSAGTNDMLIGGFGQTVADITENSVYANLNGGISTVSGARVRLLDTILGINIGELSGTNDTLSGGTGASTLYAFGSNDTLLGGATNDTLVSAAGASSNTLIGGSGLNTLITGGTSDILTGGTGQTVAIFTMNNLQVNLSGAATTGSGGTPVTVDQLVGITIAEISGSGSTLYGYTGTDTLAALGASELVVAGNGADVISASGTNDIVFGGPALDTLSSSGSSNILIAETHANTLTSTGINDTLVGNALGSTLIGTSGTGVIALYAAANEVVNLSTGTVTGSSGSDTLIGITRAQVSGSSDTIIAGSGTDILAALGISDTLIGAAGTDTLLGSGSANTLIAGSGVSVASYSAANMTVNLSSGTACQFASNCDPLFASNRDPSGAWDLGLSM
jgi:Ca2+-binding RTX toxin-like protein